MPVMVTESNPILLWQGDGMGLRKPLWMTENPKKRDKAIAAVQKLIDTSQLADAAINAPLIPVAQAACWQISDQEALTEVAIRAGKIWVAEDAATRTVTLESSNQSIALLSDTTIEDPSRWGEYVSFTSEGLGIATITVTCGTDTMSFDVLHYGTDCGIIWDASKYSYSQVQLQWIPMDGSSGCYRLARSTRSCAGRRSRTAMMVWTL